MSMQFYSAFSNMEQNAMGGGHLHTPQSIFEHTMSNPTQQSENPWFRMPQVPPISMPWSIPSHQQPDLIRFTGERPIQSFGPIVHHKRKLETPDIVDMRPKKQLITEEKMAQHFRGLQISSNAQLPVASSSASCISQSSELSASSLGLPDLLDITEKNPEPKLVISEALKKLHQEPILPNSLLSKLERPTMALVLWEPPSKRLLPVLTGSEDSSASTSSNETEDDFTNSNNNNNNINSMNNNNESILDLNQTMDVNIGDDATLEPMDL